MNATPPRAPASPRWSASPAHPSLGLEAPAGRLRGGRIAPRRGSLRRRRGGFAGRRDRTGRRRESGSRRRPRRLALWSRQPAGAAVAPRCRATAKPAPAINPRPIAAATPTPRRSLGAGNCPSGVSRGIAICVISPSGGVPIASFSSSRPTASTAMMNVGMSAKRFVEIARERAVNHAGQAPRHVLAQARQRRRVPLHDVQHQAGEVLADERRAPREHLVEHDAQRIDVDAMIGVLARAHLLRRHVFGRAHDVARQRDVAGRRRVGDGQLGHAEVQHLAVTDRSVRVHAQEDVVRLQIAVDDAVEVRRRDTAHGGQHERDRLDERHLSRSLHPIGERLAREQLHDQTRRALVLDDVEDRHDVRVIDAARGERLAAETREHLGTGGERGEDPLERDTALGADVDGRVDLRHPAAAEQALDPVLVSNHLTDRERLRWCGVRGASPLVHLCNCMIESDLPSGSKHGGERYGTSMKRVPSVKVPRACEASRVATNRCPDRLRDRRCVMIRDARRRAAGPAAAGPARSAAAAARPQADQAAGSQEAGRSRATRRRRSTRASPAT